MIFVVGHFFHLFYIVGKLTFTIFVALLFIDMLLLYVTRNGISAQRTAPERLSNGDENHIKIFIRNNYLFPIFANIVDEIPHQFQIRDFFYSLKLNNGEEKILEYNLHPVKRGEYSFGKLNVYVITLIGFVNKRFRFGEEKLVPVYPSFIQMRKFELLAISNKLTEAGIKKIRKVSTNNEFDQIREYVKGDDYRTINWKATARKSEYMVNQYQDEKSQQVFSVIDMGRTMKMPFERMTLLDYAINASLVISKIAMYKQDKAGLLTFSKNIHTMLPAERKNNQMLTILDVLYKQTTNFDEANYELLYATIKRNIKQRSLLLLYTNFEGLTSLNRQIKFFKQINKNHLLVIIFFENTEIKKVLKDKPIDVEGVYVKTIAEKFAFERKQIVKELQKNGIHAILTEPKNLTVNTINKYLELKALGLI